MPLKPKFTVLIADDNQIKRKYISDILSKSFIVTEAENSQKALGVIRKKSISVIIVNASVDESFSLPILGELKKNKALSYASIIIIDAEKRKKWRLTADVFGASCTLTGSEKPEFIISAVEKAAESSYEKKLRVEKREVEAYTESLNKKKNSGLDSLTGIYNHEQFCEIAGRMVASKQDGFYTLSNIDVSGFKIFNDRYGFSAGDNALRVIAEVLRLTAQNCGGIAGRMFADNFAVMVTSESGGLLPVIKEKINKILHIEGYSQRIQLYGGLYRIDDRTIPVSAMLDRALIAKQSIKGNYDTDEAYFNSEMLDKLLSDQWIIGEMKKALENGHFEVWYQPQYDHGTHVSVGAEALVRWRDPEKGLISPSMFIPVFEHNGFIYELDKFVWEKVCIFIRHRLDMSLPVTSVSVNVSRQDILMPGFSDFIKAIVIKYSIPRELFRLEITETAFAGLKGYIIDSVLELRSFGLTVEIDDFGSGYSSLNTLKDVPANALKIDMHFLEGSNNLSRSGNILESIVRMAKRIGMSVIAEGVETIEQADYLASIGCPSIQGYLYAKPMAEDEYEAFLNSSELGVRTENFETEEKLNLDSFWNPSSIETLVFSHYSGGACVFEYGKNGFEMLRVNAKYASVFNTSLSQEKIIKTDMLSVLVCIGGGSFSEHIERAIERRTEYSFDVCYDGRFDSGKAEYVRFTVKVIAQTERSAMLYGYVDNITAEYLAKIEEEKSKEAFARANARLHGILENLNGAVVVMGIRDGKTVSLFASGTFYSLLGYTKEQYDAEIGKEYENIIYPSDRKSLGAFFRNLIDTGKPDCIELLAMNRKKELLWLRCNASVMKENSDKNIIAYICDITEEKTAEMKISETSSQLRFLNEVSHILLVGTEPDKTIRHALENILMYFKGDRAYVFETDSEHTVFSNTYEVCAEGISSEIDKLQDIPPNKLAFWHKALSERNNIYIKDVGLLGQGREEEKEFLLSLGIKSTAAVPLFINDFYSGFIGIDNPRINISNLINLSALGDYMAVMVSRRNYEIALRRDNDNLKSFIDRMPGGYVRMLHNANGETKPIFMSDGFCDIVGMGREQINRVYGEDAYAGVHPDDVRHLRDAVGMMLSTGRPCKAKYRLLSGDGGHVWVEITGVIRRDGKDCIISDTFYSNADESLALEARRNELLDNLPCGAAIFDISNKHIKTSYVNKKYSETVGTLTEGIYGRKLLLSIHPDDRSGLYSEMRRAFAENTDIAYSLRIKSGDGKYIPFRMTAHVIKTYEGNTCVYATFFPITEEARAIDEARTERRIALEKKHEADARL